MAVRYGNSPFHAETIVPAGTSLATATAIPIKSSPALILAAGNTTGGIRLPLAAKGKMFVIKNTSALQLSTLNVYPTSGNAINALGLNTVLVMQPLTSATFIAGDSTTWHTTPVVPS